MRVRLRYAVIGSVLLFSSAVLADDGADCLRAAEKPDPGIEACGRLLAGGTLSKENGGVVYYSRGRAWKAQGDDTRAIADYSEAIKLNPQIAAAFNSRGTLYAKRKDWMSAIADFTVAIALAPILPDNLGSKDLILALAYRNRGDSYRALGRNSEAISDYRKALSFNPPAEDKAAINASLDALTSK
jgi:tetratricopeptide (TPR) repeat protein